MTTIKKHIRKTKKKKVVVRRHKRRIKRKKNRGALTQSEYRWLLKQVKKEPPTKDALISFKLKGRVMKFANIDSKEGKSEVFITRKDIPDFHLQTLQALDMPGTKLQRLPYTKTLDLLVSSKSKFKGVGIKEFPGHIEFTRKFKS